MRTASFRESPGSAHVPGPNRDDDDGRCVHSKMADITVAYIGLLAADIILRFAGFHLFHRAVRRWPTCSVESLNRTDVRSVCSAVDTAALYYFKPVLCLQRSAVVACLLRTRGVPAEVVIGCRKVPFFAHAWVEVLGDAVDGEEPAEGTFFVLERC